MLWHSPSGLSLLQHGQGWPQSLRDVLAWHVSPVPTLIDPAWVSTARAPAPLACSVPRIVSPALQGWPFRSKSVWTGALCTFLAGWSSGSDGFCFYQVQTWWKQLLTGNLVEASQPTSELLLLSAFFHLCTLQVQGSVSLLLLSLSLGLCLDLSWAFSIFPAMRIFRFSGEICSTLGYPLCNLTSTGALGFVSDNCDANTCPNLILMLT